MSNAAKQLLTELNQPQHEKLKNEFIKYLSEIEKVELMEIAKQLSWEYAAKAFDIEYKKLWNNLDVPKAAKDLGLKNEFARVLLTHIKKNLFHSLYLNLKEKVREESINIVDLRESIDEYFRYSMHEFFRAFDYQFTLSTLNKIGDPQLIIKRIEDLRKRSEFKNKLSALEPTLDYEKIFTIIDKELERRERIGQRWSIRAACEYYARNELSTESAVDQQYDLDNFHNKYLEHRKKNKLDH